MAAQAVLCMAWSETPDDMFCRVEAQLDWKDAQVNLNLSGTFVL